MQLRNDLATLEERAARLPEALQGLYSGAREASSAVGGRRAAMARLAALDAKYYARARKGVARRALPGYIRHSVIGHAGLRDDVLARIGHGRADAGAQESV